MWKCVISNLRQSKQNKANDERAVPDLDEDGEAGGKREGQDPRRSLHDGSKKEETTRLRPRRKKTVQG